MTMGRPFKPVKAFMICCKAESSATMYKNMVTRVRKLRNSAAINP
jgi:hypothetical protein